MIGAARLMPDKIEFQIRGLNFRRFSRSRKRPSQQITQACKQFGKCKRLGEIIVAALFESAHALINRPAGRENEHRSGTPLSTASGNQIEAIKVGQSEVDNERIMDAVKRNR